MRYHYSRWGAGLGLAALGTIVAIFVTAPLVVGGRGEQPGRASDPSATATVLPARTPRPPSVGQGSVTPGAVLGETATPAITATLDDAGEAQMDEQPTPNREGAGSIPVASATPTTEDSSAVQPTLVAPVVTKVPPLQPKQGTLDAWIAASNWPSHLWGRLKAVVMCESRAQPTAVSPGGHVGLLQVDPALHGPVPAGPVAQLNDGYEVYIKQGWQAWECA